MRLRGKDESLGERRTISRSFRRCLRRKLLRQLWVIPCRNLKFFLRRTLSSCFVMCTCGRPVVLSGCTEYPWN